MPCFLTAYLTPRLIQVLADIVYEMLFLLNKPKVLVCAYVVHRLNPALSHQCSEGWIYNVL